MSHNISEIIQIWALMNGFSNLSELLSGKVTLTKYLKTIIKEEKKRLPSLKKSYDECLKLRDNSKQKDSWDNIIALNKSSILKSEFRLNTALSYLSETKKASQNNDKVKIE